MPRFTHTFPTVVLAWSKVCRWRPAWPRYLPRKFSLGTVMVLIAVVGVLSAVLASYWQAYARQAALEAHWASIGIEIYVHDESGFQTLWAYQEDLTHAGNVTKWQLDQGLGSMGIYECRMEDDQWKGIDQFPDPGLSLW